MQNNTSTSKIVDGYKKALIDSSIEADTAYVPQLLTNSNGRRVLTTINNELQRCDKVFISVAFITQGGVAQLLGTLDELEKRNVEGQILTTDYLLFSDPKALDQLSKFKNLSIRVFKANGSDTGFHTKGYMFHNKGDVRIIVGSSNWTQSALSTNHEWNTHIISKAEGQYAQEIQQEFKNLWNMSVCYEEYRDEYCELYNKTKEEREEVKRLTQSLDLGHSRVLVPNQMQDSFIQNLRQIVLKGEKRALLISATGTGKTFASAFAVRQFFTDNIFQKKKALFISHREQINRQALESYRRVFGKDAKLDLLSGNDNDVNKALAATYLFSTVNMMAKDEIRSQFPADEYSIIILDECHRTGSESYQKIIDYFKPELLLGMSASPERIDGFDIYKLFHNNIASEIRLQQALENDLLCPFHYFGITDLEIDGKKSNIEKFQQLTSSKRVEHIIYYAEKYGFSGDRVKGLIFCSNKDEASELSRKFNATGKYSTVMLCGNTPQEERVLAIKRLTSDGEDKLDYIFTVDIFNEGVDIPEINQIIMLRPTESPIIFVQQLGRGLRKDKGKEYVIVIDFIGNYNNNYMIPIALSGDKTGNKDNIRRSMMHANNTIKGASTIYFDEITKKRIYESIDAANLNKAQILKRDYTSLKQKLGRIPDLMDFDKLGELDPLRIINFSLSYHNFLKKYEEEYSLKFTEVQEKILEYISYHFASGMRIHELALLELLIKSPDISDLWYNKVESITGIRPNELTTQSVRNVLSGDFFRNKPKTPSLINTETDQFEPSDDFAQAISDETFKTELLKVIEFGKKRYEYKYKHGYKGTSFNLYQKYTYTDVCWLLNWKKEEPSQNIGGYKYDKYSNTYPIFINYEKDDDIKATINYEDLFIDPSHLIAISKGQRTLKSNDVVNAITAVERNTLMPLFVRKNKDDKTSKEFYFLGTIKHNGYTEEFEMDGTKNKAVKIGYQLDTPVAEHIYKYITETSI